MVWRSIQREYEFYERYGLIVPCVLQKYEQNGGRRQFTRVHLLQLIIVLKHYLLCYLDIAVKRKNRLVKNQIVISFRDGGTKHNENIDIYFISDTRRNNHGCHTKHTAAIDHLHF